MRGKTISFRGLRADGRAHLWRLCRADRRQAMLFSRWPGSRLRATCVQTLDPRQCQAKRRTRAIAHLQGIGKVAKRLVVAALPKDKPAISSSIAEPTHFELEINEGHLAMGGVCCRTIIGSFKDRTNTKMQTDKRVERIRDGSSRQEKAGIRRVNACGEVQQRQPSLRDRPLCMGLFVKNARYVAPVPRGLQGPLGQMSSFNNTQ